MLTFLQLPLTDYDTTELHSHKFTYQVQYKWMGILYDNWEPLYRPLTSVIYSKSLSCLLFVSPPVISLASTSIQILFDWCEHYWTDIIDTMIKWNDYLLFFSQEALSKFDAIMDGTYTDAEDICEHQAPGWHQKYYLTFWTTHRCSFFLHIPLRLWYHQTSQSPFHIPSTVLVNQHILWHKTSTKLEV